MLQHETIGIQPMTNQQLGLIGGGNMARGLVGGLIKSGIAPKSIIVSDPDDNIRQALAEDYSVQTCANNSSVARVADILVPVSYTHLTLPTICSV